MEDGGSVSQILRLITKEDYLIVICFAGLLVFTEFSISTVAFLYYSTMADSNPCSK